ncbi:MAG: DNA gyrase subunit A [Clostridia bacterium]|nr:DNA gyrase subunit A [Clostridia bacterium]
MAKKTNPELSKDITFENQKILPIRMDTEVKKSFIEYSMSVIVARALPDVRDGLKPVHRRILYAMYEDHLTSDKPFRKSATTVGNVLGRYHPHGDVAVYDTMVRLAQDFSMRYPLIEGHGNFGNVDGDGAAAYRYTEARMAKIANEMLENIEKDVVPFSPNFDNKLKEPDVLPARFPNLLVNGSVGIAVGMATNIPPHNLGEVIDGTIYYMENPDASVADIMQYIKGPDFPTYATIYGTQGIIEAYTTGKGRVMVRSKAEVDEEHHRILITEIPYAVNKSMLVESMANLVKEKRVEGVTDIRDESGRAGMKIVVDYRRDANGQVILNQFYKYTQLQDTFAVNMIALVNGEPKCLSLPEILHHYIAHQETVIERRVKFDLDRALARAHILEGQMIAIEDIDEVIRIIRSNESVADAKAALMERFGLTDVQAQAIVDMTLGKLAGLERIKIMDELKEKEALIKELREILSDEGRIHRIIKDEMLEIKRKYADERRTEIVTAENEIVLEDLIERHTCVITMTRSGYIKRQPADTYVAQKRGGKGIIGMTTKEEDVVDDVHIVPSHAFLLMFTNLGRAYVRKAYQIPEAGRTAKGTSVVNVLELSEGEKVTAIIDIPAFNDGEYLMMVTRMGVIKRVAVKDFEFQRRGGKIAIDLDDGDSLDFVRYTKGENDILLASHNGQAIRFHEDQARVMGRGARGVRGMTLAEGDYITGAATVPTPAELEAADGKLMLLSITENGYGKVTPFHEYSIHGRGGKGIVCHAITEKTGLLAGVSTVSTNEDVMMITDEGTMIRTPVSDIRVCGRPSQGVIVMRLSDGAHIVNFAPVRDDEEAAKKAEEQAELVKDDDVIPDEMTDGEDENAIPDNDVISGDSASDEIELLDINAPGAEDEE